jgi:hypothetical protein
VEGLRFRREMVGELREQWGEIEKLLGRVNLSNDPDTLIFKLTNSGAFLVKFLYLAMQFNDVVPYRFMWKVKIPLRIKTFLWLMLKKRILTRNVLLQRGGV